MLEVPFWGSLKLGGSFDLLNQSQEASENDRQYFSDGFRLSGFVCLEATL